MCTGKYIRTRDNRTMHVMQLFFSEAEESDVSDAEESEDDNLVIAPQEGNLEPECQEEQHEVEPQDDQQEQPPVEPLPLLRKSKKLTSRPDRFVTNIFD